MPIHMRMRKLRGPHMKKSMPFEPFRTHTQPVNLVDLEARFDDGRRGHARRAEGHGPRQAQGRAGQGARQRRADQEADRPRPRLRGSARAAIEDGRRHRAGHRPLASGQPMLSTILSAFTVPEIRKKLLFTAAMLALYRSAPTSRCPGINTQAVKRVQEKFGGGGVLNLLNTFSGGGLSPHRALRARDHALHHGVDHPAAAARSSCPSLEKLAKEGEVGQAAHHAVHALPDRRPRLRPVDRLRVPLQVLQLAGRRSR